MRSFSYTPRAGFREVFLLDSSRKFSEEFLCHSSSWFSEKCLFTFLILILVRRFPYTPDVCFSEEFPLHSLY